MISDKIVQTDWIRGTKMKRKRLDRDLWGFQHFPYYQLRMETADFNGLVSLLLLTDGEYYYWDLPRSGKIPVCGANMVWLQLIPDNKSRVITAKYLPEKKILNGKEYSHSVSVWYTDVVERIEYDLDGVAAFVDKYIDVIFTPQGEVIIDDKDELDHAYQSGELTLEQYNHAIHESNLIVEELCSDIHLTEELCSQILKNVMEQINNGLKPFKDNSLSN